LQPPSYEELTYASQLWGPEPRTLQNSGRQSDDLITKSGKEPRDMFPQRMVFSQVA
jgi:hypothetical protein